MPREQQYDRILGDGLGRLRVVIETEGKVVTGFVVQIEIWHDGQWKPVRRYDTVHGQPHIDTLDVRGRTTSKEWLSLSNNDALNLAITDLKTNWEQYLVSFERQ